MAKEDSSVPEVKGRFKPADVLPHGGAMLVLDEILDYDDDRVVAAARIKESSLFLNADNRVPAWMGLEYMAQCIAAWEGIRARRNNQPIEIGYLIATRRYMAQGGGFFVGDRLEVTARRVQHEGPLAVFECTIESQHCTVQGNVSVYRSNVPPDRGTFGK